MAKPAPPPIRVATTPGGPVTYLVYLSPEALPPVRSGDLADAWGAAREAAAGSEWGTARAFRFLQDDGETLDLVLSDEDACCWAAAVDHTAAIQTTYGLSLCLRLLALIDLIARAPWLGAFCRIGRAGAALDPALVRAAATVPLTRQAAFDERRFRIQLGAAGPTPPMPQLLNTGVDR